MRGDKILVNKKHKHAAKEIYKSIRDYVFSLNRPIAISVAGESGAGKSEIASELVRLFSEKDQVETILLAQDDYFKRPPKTNSEARRKENLDVGVHEVKIKWLDRNVEEAKKKNVNAKTSGAPYLEDNNTIIKPIVDYDNDVIHDEFVSVKGVKIIVAEGTYTMLLENVDIRVFIDIDYRQTEKHRRKRARDVLDEHTLKVLEKEHSIISSHKKDADVIIDSDYKLDYTNPSFKI